MNIDWKVTAGILGAVMVAMIAGYFSIFGEVVNLQDTVRQLDVNVEHRLTVLETKLDLLLEDNDYFAAKP